MKYRLFNPLKVNDKLYNQHCLLFVKTFINNRLLQQAENFNDSLLVITVSFVKSNKVLFFLKH